MHSLTVLYPNKEGAKFDFEYYMHTHIPFANGLLGHDFKVTKGIASAQGGQAAFLCTAKDGCPLVETFLRKRKLAQKAPAMGPSVVTAACPSCWWGGTREKRK